MKRAIALNGFGSSNWIGGVYYIRNIAFQLSQNENITNRYKIIVFTTPELREVFADLPKEIRIVEIKGRISNAKLLLNYIINKVAIAYPGGRKMKYFGILPVSWFPDFQHNYYPELFSKEEMDSRNTFLSSIARSGNSVILSSQDCLKDFREFYAPIDSDVEVMRFVSFIEPEITSFNEELEKKILEKHNLQNLKYVCVMNQFWKHKNHTVVLDAMKHFYENNPESKLAFVFTGKMLDDRWPDYINELRKTFETEPIKSHAVLLGFIDRIDQLVIMKNAELIIQPSLFEGWGTVVEDAKVLDKTILLSDIPVHREQKNNNCVLFNPKDPRTLANLIEQECHKSRSESTEDGLKDMYERAKEYSKGFELLIRNKGYLE